MRNFRAILAQDNTETAEGYLVRVFPAGCFEWRALPLTIRAVVNDEGGHYGAFPLGRMDTIAMDGNLVVATGVLDDEGEGEDADRRRDYIRQIEAGIINGISVDPGSIEVAEEDVCTETDEEGFCTEMQIRLVFNRYQIAAATVVATPALEGTLIELDPVMDDEGMAPAANDAVAASAAATLDTIPAAWLDEPADLPAIDGPDGRTPQVTADGRVFGYLASWEDCHVAFSDRCQTPWHSASGYAYALHCGPFALDNGDRRRLAPLAVQGGHYPTQGIDPSTGERFARQWQNAQAHYDDPQACAAYVNIGENEHGIWYSGALRQGVSEEQVALLSRHQLSGDWRRPDRDMELIGMCSVNFPGFIRRVAVTAAATPGEFDIDAAIVGGPRVPRHASLASTSCCEACAASAGSCSAHPVTDEDRLASLERELLGLRSLVGTLTRHAPAVRADLKARLGA